MMLPGPFRASFTQSSPSVTTKTSPSSCWCTGSEWFGAYSMYCTRCSGVDTLGQRLETDLPGTVAAAVLGPVEVTLVGVEDRAHGPSRSCVRRRAIAWNRGAGPRKPRRTRDHCLARHRAQASDRRRPAGVVARRRAGQPARRGGRGAAARPAPGGARAVGRHGPPVSASSTARQASAPTTPARAPTRRSSPTP